MRRRKTLLGLTAPVQQRLAHAWLRNYFPYYNKLEIEFPESEWNPHQVEKEKINKGPRLLCLQKGISMHVATQYTML
jgi:hypothetical protein